MIDCQGLIKWTSGRIDVLHLDYTWDVGPTYIIPDPELNTDRLGWREGDYFKVVDYNGKKHLVKVDKLEEFIIKGVKEHESRGETVIEK